MCKLMKCILLATHKGLQRGFRLEKSVKDDLLEEDPRFQIFLDQTAVSQKIVFSPKAYMYIHFLNAIVVRA